MMNRLAVLALFAIHTLQATPLAITGEVAEGTFARQYLRILGTDFLLLAISDAPSAPHTDCDIDDLCNINSILPLPLQYYGLDTAHMLKYLNTTIELSGEFPEYDTGRIEGFVHYKSEAFILQPNPAAYDIDIELAGIAKGFLRGEVAPFVNLRISGSGRATYYPFEGDLVGSFVGTATPIPEPSTLMMVLGAFGLLRLATARVGAG